MTPLKSEYLLKLIALFIKGEAIFGNVHEFSNWLEKAHCNSTAQLYKDLLIIPGGIDFVTAELDQLAEGYPA